MEIRTGTAGYDNGRDSKILIKTSHPFDKRDNGLFFRRDHLLHQFVADHEISGRGIFVDQQQGTAAFHTFHQIGRLGGAAAGVFRGKTAGIPAVGQMTDERGDIYAGDTAAVLGPEFPRALIRDDQFPAVAADMIIHCALQRLQYGGFSMISAAHEQGDTSANPHAGDGASVRKL